jgi:two-component system, OmpR family, response regulator
MPTTRLPVRLLTLSMLGSQQTSASSLAELLSLSRSEPRLFVVALPDCGRAESPLTPLRAQSHARPRLIVVSRWRGDNAAMHVLIVEDERKLAELVARGLREEGHAADVVGNGEEAVWLAQATGFDAIVLDVMLPGLDGFSVCRRLRDKGIWTPVLMLTAREAVEDRIEGLDAGADDYLAKPFSFDELVARLRALTRRAPVERPTLLVVGELRLDPAAHRAWAGDGELDLSAKEFALLELFMRNPGAVLSRDQLLDGAWDLSFERRSNVVDVYVRYLRGKVGRDAIETVRGVGYRLRVAS